MNEYERKVKDFHVATATAIDVPMTVELLKLRRALIAEEVRELFEEIDACIDVLGQGHAVARPRMQALVKEMADVQYVLSGMAVSFGLPAQQVFDRVHDSNMSKLGADGKPLFREDGKVLKGPAYHPPLLDDII